MSARPEAGEPSPFWRFSLAFYGRPGVAPACLRCQDEARADVNLVLFMLWQASFGVRFDPAAVAALEARVAPWRLRVVEPLRAIRRHLKDTPILPAGEAYRDRIKAVELEAERLLQEALFAAAPAPVVSSPLAPAEIAAMAKDNLGAYEAAARLTLPAEAVLLLIARLGEMPRPGASA